MRASSARVPARKVGHALSVGAQIKHQSSGQAEHAVDLSALKAIWLVPPSERAQDPVRVAELDEAFHQGLVLATGNLEMARVHLDITEKICIIRRLDFTKPKLIDATYDEHAKILRLLIERKATQAVLLLNSHIEASKAEVRKITLHMLHSARQKIPG